MIGEAIIALGLFVLGYGAILASGFALPPPVRAWCAYPVGAALWMTVTVAFLALRLPFHPEYVLPGVVIMAVALAAALRLRSRQGPVSPDGVLDRHAVVAGVIVAGVSGLSAAVNMTAMTNDAYWILRQVYTILEADGVYGPAEFMALRSFPIGVAALQLPADLIGRDYLVSQPTVLGATGIGAMLTVVATGMRAIGVEEERLQRTLLAAGCFVVTGFFIVFQLFYIRGNLESGIYAALAMTTLWLSAQTGRLGWAAIGTLSFVASILLRVENPLFLLPLVAVAVASRDIPRSGRLTVLGGYGAIAFGWYGAVLLPSGTGAVMDARTIGLTIAAAVGLAVVFAVVQRGGRWGRFLERHIGALIVVGISLATVAATTYKPDWMADVFVNVTLNLFEPAQGLWGVTWLILVPLFLLGAVRPVIANERLLTVPTASYLLLVYLSGAFAGIPHERGWASSANRMLSVIAFAMLAYVLMRYAVEGRTRGGSDLPVDPDGSVTSGPRLSTGGAPRREDRHVVRSEQQ